MAALGLKLSMIFTVAVIIGITTLAFIFILNFLGITSPILLLVFVASFNLMQWLVAPYLIDIFYGVKEMPREQYPWLYDAVERLSKKVGIKMPKLMLADIPYPNAFAYGSPLSGNRVAVTRGLLNTLSPEEIEAVLGHELGHLAHRDVQVMMFASMLPSFFYILSRSIFWTSVSDRDRDSGTLALIGVASLVAYFLLSLLVLHLSRLREYYADFFSVQVAPNPKIGAKRLMSALAKIVTAMGEMKARGIEMKVMGFKELFIADPDTAVNEAASLSGLVVAKKLMKRELTIGDRLIEIFSTHPHIVSRLRTLANLAEIKEY